MNGFLFSVILFISLLPVAEASCIDRVTKDMKAVFVEKDIKLPADPWLENFAKASCECSTKVDAKMSLDECKKQILLDQQNAKKNLLHAFNNCMMEMGAQPDFLIPRTKSYCACSIKKEPKSEAFIKCSTDHLSLAKDKELFMTDCLTQTKISMKSGPPVAEAVLNQLATDLCSCLVIPAEAQKFEQKYFQSPQYKIDDDNCRKEAVGKVKSVPKKK